MTAKSVEEPQKVEGKSAVDRKRRRKTMKVVARKAMQAKAATYGACAKDGVQEKTLMALYCTGNNLVKNLKVHFYRE